MGEEEMGGKLGRVEEGETVVRMYCKKESIFDNKNIEKTIYWNKVINEIKDIQKKILSSDERLNKQK